MIICYVMLASSTLVVDCLIEGEIALQTSHQEGPVYLRLTDFGSAMGLTRDGGQCSGSGILHCFRGRSVLAVYIRRHLQDFRTLHLVEVGGQHPLHELP